MTSKNGNESEDFDIFEDTFGVRKRDLELRLEDFNNGKQIIDFLESLYYDNLDHKAEYDDGLTEEDALDVSWKDVLNKEDKKKIP